MLARGQAAADEGRQSQFRVFGERIGFGSAKDQDRLAGRIVQHPAAGTILQVRLQIAMSFRVHFSIQEVG